MTLTRFPNFFLKKQHAKGPMVVRPRFCCIWGVAASVVRYAAAVVVVVSVVPI